MKTILILFFFCIFHFFYAQNNLNKKYLIVTYYRSFNNSLHKGQSHSWIIDLDSLENSNSKLSPFYFSGYSNALLQKCINGQIVFPFDTFNDEKFDFNKEELIAQNQTKIIINSERKEVMTIRKKWINGLKERIEVFLTPITGYLCSCPIDKQNGKKINYNGNIYLPVANVNFDIDFSLDSLDLFQLQNKMRLTNTSNVPWQ